MVAGWVCRARRLCVGHVFSGLKPRTAPRLRLGKRRVWRCSILLSFVRAAFHRLRIWQALKRIWIYRHDAFQQCEFFLTRAQFSPRGVGGASPSKPMPDTPLAEAKPRLGSGALAPENQAVRGWRLCAHPRPVRGFQGRRGSLWGSRGGGPQSRGLRVCGWGRLGPSGWRTR